MSQQCANRLIKAGKIRAERVPIVSKMGLPEPRNEAQPRELSDLEKALVSGKEIGRFLKRLRDLLGKQG
jgi:hypothetical protein